MTSPPDPTRVTAALADAPGRVAELLRAADLTALRARAAPDDWSAREV